MIKHAIRGALLAVLIAGPVLAQSTGANNTTAPGSSTLIGIKDGSGKLQAASAGNPVPVTGTVTVTGAGDASAANQTATQANAGSDATKAQAVQGITGGKAITVASVGPTTGTITSVASSASDGTVLALNTARKGAAVYNDSSQVLYLALASTTSSATNYTVQIAPGGYYELPTVQGGVYTGVIKGIWASANGFARVTEWN